MTLPAPIITVPDGYTWYHLSRDGADVKTHLTTLNMSPRTQKALLEEETRPRLTLTQSKHLIVILRGVNLHPDSDPEDMISLRLWVTDNVIVSLYKRPLMAVNELIDDIKNGDTPKDPGAFLAHLTSKLFTRMQHVINKEDDTLDGIEESLLQECDLQQLRYELTGLRTEAITLRRYIAPQRDVMSALINVEKPWMNDEDKTMLRENLDHITRLVENLDLIRERAGILQDEIGNRYNDRMNRNMYLLSLIATVFLPLGFLTGLLGINVGGIPGADNPHAFYIFSGILISMAVGAVLFFLWRKWI